MRKTTAVTEATQPATSTEGQTCPKCQLARAETQHSCPRCGLEFARWNPEVADTVKQLDADGEALWTAAIADWGNEERHLAFVKHCSLAGMLAASGRRYRDWLVTHPADTTAIAMQKRILGMAQAMLGSNSTRPSASMLSSKWFWTITIVAMTAGMTAAFLIRR